MVSDVQALEGQKKIEKLRTRQQGNSTILSGISVDHVVQSKALYLPTAASMQATPVVVDENVMGTRIVDWFPENPTQYDAQSYSHQSSSGGTSCSMGASSYGELVFLTEAQARPDNGVQQAEGCGDDNVPMSKLFGQLTKNDVPLAFTSQMIDTTYLKFFRVENTSKLRSKIEAKIADSRKLVVLRDDVIPTVRAEVLGRRENETNRLSKKWQRILLIRAQKMIRGFLARRKVLKICYDLYRASNLRRIQAMVRR